MNIKVLYIQLLGATILTLTTPQITALEDLEFEGTNNRRVLQNTDETRAENRTKRLRQTSTEKTTPSPPADDDEDKKTLAQQVADGKYGLIQKEIFASPAERPGIISYEVNPEVPKDNVNNLGGLQPEEIWLAENHLLVLRGGIYNNGNDQSGKSVWPPIDNYIAPQRQVKIPPNPKVPPPFPVQLKDGGPIEFIKGKNGSGGPILPFFDPRFGPPNFFPFPQYPGPGDNSSSSGKQGNFSEGNGLNPPFPFPPPPGIGLFPPAVAFLPPPGNLTELDEDDPSIYYPPPYDFVYQKDNSSFVAPGPLVPGIVLPPPPNFFAPFENKTKAAGTKQASSRKPSKHKSRPTQFVQETVTRKPTRPTKPPKSTVSVTIITPKTTLAPIVVSTGDSIQNEIIPPRTLPAHTPVGEWIPIPAPRPFYVSEIKTLRGGGKMKFPVPSNQWDFNNTALTFSPIKDDLGRGYDYTPPRKKGRVFSTTVAPMNGFRPIYVPPSVISTSTQRPSTIVYTSTFSTHKPPDDYYFYAEPQINNYPYRKRPLGDYYDYGDKVNEVNTVAPSELFNDVSVKSPADIQQSHFELFRQQFEPSSTTSTPINFYYFDKNSQKPSEGPNFKLHDVRSNRVNSKHLSPPPRPTTEKPPIFEYSYSAPGYGTVENPKVGANFITTPKPVQYDINYPVAIENDAYSLLPYPNHQKASNIYKHQATKRPLYYNTRGSGYSGEDGYSRDEVYRVKPFRQQSVSDTTPKYYSVFGQKLPEDEVDGPTTPIPAPSGKHYYNYEGKDNQAKAPNRQNVKFPSDDYYDVPSEQPYYPSKSAYREPSSAQNYNQRYQYPNYYRVSSPQYDPYASYNEEELVQPGHHLHSDTNVNLKRPLPPLEPDAEIIDPAYVSGRGNSFISYQLPGSGGHFYFLTPQAIKHTSPQSQPYPPGYSGYYKRNVESKKRGPRSSRTLAS